MEQKPSGGSIILDDFIQGCRLLIIYQLERNYIMRQLSCDPNVEVSGRNVLAILENMQAEDIRPYAEKYGLTEIDPQQWYPAQDWLSLMNDLAQNTNFMQNIVAIGMAVAENVHLPPNMDCFIKFLNMWDDIYHMQHRGGEIGNHHVKKIDDSYYEVSFTDIYPDLLSYGIAHGFARRLLPKGTFVKIWYDENVRRQDENDELTVMYLQW